MVLLLLLLLLLLCYPNPNPIPNPIPFFSIVVAEHYDEIVFNEPTPELWELLQSHPQPILPEQGDFCNE